MSPLSTTSAASTAAPSAQRELFLDQTHTGPHAAYTRYALGLLLTQDGSTTRLCEHIVGGPIALSVLEQNVTDQVPAIVRQSLPGTLFIERVTSLIGHGQVMMDNLSYIALEGLAPSLRDDLQAGRLPIGHLLAQLWVQRHALPLSPELCQRLWGYTGSPDAAATRNYTIATAENPIMLICESYRRGMLQGAA